MDAEVLTSTTASYDSIVAAYERQTSSPPDAVLSFRDSFVDALPSSAFVADLGCGPGRDLQAFRSAGLWAVGVDASTQMTRRVAEQGLPVVVGDLRQAPLASARWHGVWSSASLLHVMHEEVLLTLQDWARLLASGGLLGLTTSLGHDDSGWEAVPYAPGTQVRQEPLRRWFAHHDRDFIERSLAEAGFRVVEASVRESHRTWLHLLARREH